MTYGRDIRREIIKAVAETTDEWSERDKEIAKAAILATADRLLEFTLEISSELVGAQLYSEALVAGLFIKKLKTIKGEHNSC